MKLLKQWAKEETLPWKERKPLDEKRSFIAEWERQQESLADKSDAYMQQLAILTFK